MFGNARPGWYGRSQTAKAALVTLTLLLLLAVGCGGGSSSSGSISGAYEFVATSNTTSGWTTLIEANLSANGAQTTANGPNQVQTATRLNGVWYVNGDGQCPYSLPGQNSVEGTVSGNDITLTFNEGGNVFTGDGIVSGSSISGTYSGGNSDCSDSGTFTATKVPNLAGTFSGTLNFPSGADLVTATLTETAGNVLTVQTTLTGADNGTFGFTGSAVGNVMFVSGTVNGNQFSLFGYFDSSGVYNGTANSIQVFDDNAGDGIYANYGLLVEQ
ncbi:MAG: hypothetical protein WB711_07845 [Terriglobales bacterium]